ncbi:tRNA 2-thiouridine(34) synthase MnmA [Candidatus Pantoea edessiphila]|uniref:tRNA-specific 2-thiouridylase MnmA n=1 Tax=Candidatus Pantoea edessiphila TaxID=2044610 RepID=A0A2P5SYU6_9GAMM|nr:tRNA 2-thiouridine(34) synthase MnmA [Candidatus Pantoea edessiphila]MBK4775364.1 tRNA 2-thiouridine(34) synthase MnmA [Pantoea sp. Edef]PPI87504.1 tRNA 2-thiouridine(34) synthase MnmA [Candidatus Pantoea edessiphila]
MFINKKKKVIIGMSGGVDSSVSAWLLKKQNYHVEGLFMKNWEEDDGKGCNAINDLSDAQSVCDKLGIYLHKISFAAEYWDDVFKPFLEGYKMGYTPNPDIICNKEIKFKLFLEFAIKELEADFISTGHYVRSKYIFGKSYLLRGIDLTKDQSYFLYILNQKQIKKTIFPLGTIKKTQVRNIAKKLNFINASKKDSTGICFIGKRNFCNFLKTYLPCQPGDIISINGQKIGQHQGVIYYTLGQRKGLGIGGLKKCDNNPWYVIEKEVLRNRLVVAQGRYHPCLFSIGLIASNLHWVDSNLIKNISQCTVKTRYQQPDINCKIIPCFNNSLKVIFAKPVFAITPGQSAVFYLNQFCLGGGIIQERLPLL